MGIPPRMGADPSSALFSDMYSLSFPSDVFHEVTWAPNRYTVALAPEGRLRVTVLSFWETGILTMYILGATLKRQRYSRSF